jgi:thioredoxin reductase (NADPH)
MIETRVAVIGAGPAGVAAAIQLQRAGIAPLLIEKQRVGGLLHQANLVENYPGFPGGISGRAFCQRLTRQLRVAGVALEQADVRGLDVGAAHFSLQLADGRQVKAGIVVVASGTMPRPGSWPGLATIDPRCVFDSVAPLRRRAGLRIAIIGGGDAAFDYAASLAPRHQVWVVHRSPESACLPLLWQRCREEESITSLPDATIASLAPGTGGRGVRLEFTGALPPLEVDVLLPAIGRVPATAFFAPGLRSALADLVAQKRLFLCGDVHNGRLRQTALAVGDGVRAALEICQAEGVGVGP